MLGLAGAPGHRRDAAQVAQSVVVSPAQGFPSLCEQRGEDDPSDSRQGSEDRRVMLLHWVPRLALLAADEASRERVDLPMGVRELSIDEPEAGDKRGDVGSGRLRRSGLDRHRLLARDREDVGRIEAANPMPL